MIHENSRAAFGEESIKLDRRCSEVLGAILQMGAATDRMVNDFLGYGDMNCVRPRITELKKKGLVYEDGKIKCEKTKKKVRILRVKPAPGFEQEMTQASLF